MGMLRAHPSEFKNGWTLQVRPVLSKIKQLRPSTTIFACESSSVNDCDDKSISLSIEPKFAFIFEMTYEFGAILSDEMIFVSAQSSSFHFFNML